MYISYHSDTTMSTYQFVQNKHRFLCILLHPVIIMCKLQKEVATMTVSKENTRTNITISKEMKQELTEIAKNENRSFNNLVITILKDYLNKRGQQ